MILFSPSLRYLYSFVILNDPLRQTNQMACTHDTPKLPSDYRRAKSSKATHWVVRDIHLSVPPVSFSMTPTVSMEDIYRSWWGLAPVARLAANSVAGLRRDIFLRRKRKFHLPDVPCTTTTLLSRHYTTRLPPVVSKH